MTEPEIDRQTSDVNPRDHPTPWQPKSTLTQVSDLWIPTYLAETPQTRGWGRAHSRQLKSSQKDRSFEKCIPQMLIPWGDTQWHSTNAHRWSVFWSKYFLWSTIASLISTSSLRSVRDLLLKTSRSQLWRLISEDMIISSIDSTTLEDIIDSRVEEVWHHFRSVFDRYLWSNAKKRFADNSSLKQLNRFLIKFFNRLLILKNIKYLNNYYKMIWNNFKPTVNQLIYWIEVSLKQ